MNNQVEKALSTLFDKHRVIFWYDAKKELRDEFNALDLPFVTKAEIANNEYALKHRILREEPEQKFLLYHEGERPPEDQNWLLDVLLSHFEFHADQTILWLSEMGMGAKHADLVEEHWEFFRSAERRGKLKALGACDDDTKKQLRMKMLAVCATTQDARLDAVLERLLGELANEKNGVNGTTTPVLIEEEGASGVGDGKMRLIERSRLSDFLWQEAKHAFGYSSHAPSIKDFAAQLFSSCFKSGLGEKPSLNDKARVFMQRWKDNRTCKDAFSNLSDRFAKELRIDRILEKRDYRDVLEMDYFQVIDQKVVSALVAALCNRTIGLSELENHVRLRRQSLWHEKYKSLYDAITSAAQFQHAQECADLEMASAENGVERYCKHWFKIDQAYRQFHHHVRKSGEQNLLNKLLGQVENFYTNNFVLKLGDRFQELISGLDEWRIPPYHRQDQFFDRWVQPFLAKDNKVCVIISDGLRFEVAEELQRAIRQEDRFEAELSPMVSMLPSYTQLGMAALLPHTELSFADNDSGNIRVDGQPSDGLANRSKILKNALKERGDAAKAEYLLTLDREMKREILKANDVLYIYHDKIDSADEDGKFNAAQEAIEDLVKLIKNLGNNNVTNFIVTADHGFLHQISELDESDLSCADVAEEKVFYKDRRFVLGRGLTASAGTHTFSSAQLGLSGDVTAQIPKSINRFPLKGAKKRYVHGGASLQEIVLPVLKINKKRASDTTLVEVDILGSSSSSITSGQLAVTLYQREAVTEKIRPRTLKAGIYTQDGQLISDQHELCFDLASDNPREREITVRFILTSEAEKANNADVDLILQDKVADTTVDRPYASRRYSMRRSFTSDFDMF